MFSRHEHEDGTWSLQHRASRAWLRVESWGGLVTATAETLEEAERFAVETISRGADEVARLAADCDAVLVALGNDPHINGRETADRPYLHLPPTQQDLWRAAVGARPDAALVLVSSYPYSLGDLADGAAAVVWSSHAGQELGHGVMDVLDGRVEPTGRLAQTWWADESHVGDIFDYDIIGSRQTWWYNPNAPLYPLGHGLTYSEVRYEALDVVDGDRAVVTLANAGDREAHELVQVYAVNQDPLIGRRMLGHARAVLAPGETREVDVALHLDRLQVWDAIAGDFVAASTPWRVVAAPSAALRGPSVDLETPTRGEVATAVLPLTVWHAPAWRDVVGVPTGVIEGTAYRARGEIGEVSWPALEPLPARLGLLLRAEKGRGGPVEVLAGGAAVEAIPDPQREGEWHVVTVDCPTPGATDLTLRLHGSTAVAEVSEQ